MLGGGGRGNWELDYEPHSDLRDSPEKEVEKEVFQGERKKKPRRREIRSITEMGYGPPSRKKKASEGPSG